jgi:hypothetical protein
VKKYMVEIPLETIALGAKRARNAAYLTALKAALNPPPCAWERPARIQPNLRKTRRAARKLSRSLKISPVWKFRIMSTGSRVRMIHLGGVAFDEFPVFRELRPIFLAVPVSDFRDMLVQQWQGAFDQALDRVRPLSSSSRTAMIGRILKTAWIAVVWWRSP